MRDSCIPDIDYDYWYCLRFVFTEKLIYRLHKAIHSPSFFHRFFHFASIAAYNTNLRRHQTGFSAFSWFSLYRRSYTPCRRCCLCGTSTRELVARVTAIPDASSCACSRYSATRTRPSRCRICSLWTYCPWSASRCRNCRCCCSSYCRCRTSSGLISMPGDGPRTALRRCLSSLPTARACFRRSFLKQISLHHTLLDRATKTRPNQNIWIFVFWQSRSCRNNPSIALLVCLLSDFGVFSVGRGISDFS